MRTVLMLSLLIVVLVVVSSCSFKVEGTAGKPSASDESPATPEAAGGDTGAPTTSGLEVVGVLVGDARDEASDKITNEATEFTPSTPVIYVDAGIKGLKTGAKITGTMTAIKVTTVEGQTIEDYEVMSTDVEAPGTESTASFEFSAPDAGWPVGSYEITIKVEGELVHTVALTVAGSGV